MSYIVLKNVSLTYNPDAPVGGIEALQDLSFEVAKGSLTSIIGPSGCGKSTLLYCIGNLLELTMGSIVIDGKHPQEARRNRMFGYVPQDPTLMNWKTVFENIVLPSKIMGIRKNNRISELLELVGLKGFEKNYPREL